MQLRAARAHSKMKLLQLTIALVFCLCVFVSANTSLLTIKMNLLGDGKRRNPMAIHAISYGSAASALTMFVITFALFSSII